MPHVCVIILTALYYSQGIEFVFDPTVKELYPGSLDYFARYNIKSKISVDDAILHKNYSIGVSAFRLESFVSYYEYYVGLYRHSVVYDQ